LRNRSGILGDRGSNFEETALFEVREKLDHKRILYISALLGMAFTRRAFAKESYQAPRMSSKRFSAARACTSIPRGR